MIIVRGFLVGIAVVLGLSFDQAARAADVVLDSSTGYTIPAQINGHPVRLRVDLAASGYVVLNPDVAQRANLNGSMVRSRTLIGPHELRGGSNAVRLAIAGTELRERVAWFDRDVVENADGLISPELLPYDNVVWRLAPDQSDRREFDIGLSYTKSQGLFLPYSINDQRIDVTFSVTQPHTRATAAAGAVIAAAFGGSWSGEAISEVISFGVARPARPMHLERPLTVGGVMVPDLLIRTSDHRGNFTLPTDQPADPGEIVVTGQTRSRQRAVLGMTVGLDRLGTCSSASYRKAGRMLRLRCGA